MPLYEFRCPNGHDFEKFYRSIGTASSEAECPVCGAVAQRVISTAGLVFKGSGFYITDYGKDGKKAEREATAAKTKADSKEKSAPAESGAGASGSSDGSSTTSKSSESATTSSSAEKAPAKPAPSTKTSE